MNIKGTLGVAGATLALVLVAGMAAQAKDTRNVLLPHDATLAGTHLKSGKYQVRWETHSPEATVTFEQGKKVMATVEGKVVDRGKRYDRNEVVYNENPDGSQAIQELRFSGSSEVVVFNE